MTESLATPDGEAISLDAAEKLFAQAMAAPEPSEPVAPAPRKRSEAPGKAAAPAGGADRARVSDSKPAPRRGRPPKKTPAAGGDSSPGGGRDYSDELTGIVQLGFGALSATGNLADAGALMVHGPGMVKAWNSAAQENEYVRKGIEFLTKGGVWGAVVVSTMPFVLQVAANHKGIKAEQVAGLGVKEPEVLENMALTAVQQMAQQPEPAAA